MKQIIQSYRTGELWLADVPAPARRASGAVVRTAASAISAGTERMLIELAQKTLIGKARARPDLVKRVIGRIKTEGLSQTLEKVFAKLDTPIPLGYSCAGTVIESGVSDFKAGDRAACAGAGYATHSEVNFVPKNLLARVPDNVSFEDAAFTSVGAIAIQGVRQADVRFGERVVVIGLGLLGLLTVQILKAAGCLVLGSDRDESRVQLARELGADHVVTGDAIDASAAFTQGHGADCVIITAATPSNEPIEAAAQIARQKGRVVIVGMVGMDVPREPFYKKELDLRLSMSNGPGRYDNAYEEGGHDYPFAHVRWTEQRNMQTFLELVSAGKITPGKLITHRFTIDRALDAYEMMTSDRERYLGIVINYPADAKDQISRTIEFHRAKPTSGKIKAGLIGAGNFAKSVLIPAIKRIDDLDLVGICTSTGMSAQSTGEKHEFAYATTDAEQVLRDASINTLFITTRHDSHASLACAGLVAGKHVFVEKPLCVREDQIGEYERAIDLPQAAVRLMVGFNRRFSPHTRAIQDFFAARRTPMFITYRVNAGMVSKESWLHDEQVGGGRIIGELCHFIDWCEAVIGATPIDVEASAISTDDARLTSEDSVAVNIRYDDGSVASIQYVALGANSLAKERAEVFADGRVVVMDDFCTTTFHGGDKRAPLKTKQAKGFDEELAAFVGAIRDADAPPPIEFASMVRTTRLTFAIRESIARGKPVALGRGLAPQPPEPSEATV